MINMGVKTSYIELTHDEGYGDDLIQHINSALSGKDMRAEKVVDGDLLGAASVAFGALVGAHATDDSVQGKARIRLRKALGFSGNSPD